MAKMSIQDREIFLSAPHVAIIAVARQEGPPLAVPVWYSYERGGDVLVQTIEGSLKDRLVRRREEFTLVVQDATPPYRYVSVEGTLVSPPVPASKEAVESLAERYLAEVGLADYLASMEGVAMMEIRMTPRRWFAVDGL